MSRLITIKMAMLSLLFVLISGKVCTSFQDSSHIAFQASTGDVGDDDLKDDDSFKTGQADQSNWILNSVKITNLNEFLEITPIPESLLIKQHTPSPIDRPPKV